MDIAALVAWVVTALGGFYLLGTWISRGGAKQQDGGGSSRLPVPVVFGHFALAVAGLVVWIIYLVVDKQSLAWTAFGLLVLIALLGFAMLLRWLPVYRTQPAGAEAPAERHFPVVVVAGHGLFAVATVVLVLLAALDAGGA